MTVYFGSNVSGFSSNELWVQNTGVSTNERFEGSIDTNTGIGTRTERYSTFAFEASGLTYEYEGSWTLSASVGLLTTTVSASGTYHTIRVRSDDTVIATATGLSFNVDFGSETSLTLLDLLNPILDPVLGLLLGDGATESFAKLHKGATPNIADLAFSGDDSLQGGLQDDVLYGSAGNDTLNGSAGADLMDGGDGDDLYYIDDLNDVVVDSGGNDRAIILVEGYDTSTLAGIEDITALTPTGGGQGTDGPDTQVGGSGDDVLGGGAGPDTLIGGSGNDILTGGADDDVIAGGADDDALYGGEGNDVIDGGAGNDALIGGAGADTMYGREGDDTYSVDDIGDIVAEAPGQGTDTVVSSIDYALPDNVENLFLLAGASLGIGNNMDNLGYGTLGRDTLNGLDGRDEIHGLAGADELRGGTGADELHGNLGQDSLYGGSGDDSLEGGKGHDALYGGKGNDQLLGGNGHDRLIGGPGSDWLGGSNGRDTLAGRLGDDTLDGGYGSDWLVGGRGADSFVFDAVTDSTVAASGMDLIADFASGQGDRIDLSRIDANWLTPADEAFSFIGAAAFGLQAGELRYDRVSGGSYLSADADGNGTADFAVFLKDAAVLTKDDFLL